MKNAGIVLLMVSILLAGCNTTEPESTSESVSSPVTTTEPDKNQSSESETEGNGEDTEANGNENAETNQSSMTYEIAGTSVTKAQHTYASDEMPFSIHLTEDFYLTSEEPGKDLVVYKENEALMMRIELLSLADATIEQIEASTIDLVKAIENHSHAEDFLPKQFESSSDYSKGFLIENESDKVVVLLKEQGEYMIRYTIFDDYMTSVTDAFITVGNTIEITE